MNKNIIHYVQNRYSAKAFDPTKKISNENIEKVKELLRFSASSTNAQPWYFIIASTDEGKARIAKSTEAFKFNTPSILNASHVVIFASRLDMTEEHLLKVLEQEEKDGRFKAAPSFKEQMHQGRSWFINIHKNEFKDIDQWMAKQTYLNVGAFLLGVSALDIDAVPMEGFDPKILDAEFGLDKKGYTSLVLVPIGYHDEEKDYNKAMPKSRLPYTDILTEV